MSEKKLFENKRAGDVYNRTTIATHDINVVLVHPRIPQNTGNIARLCVGSGTRLHLVHPLGFSTDDTMLKRAGLDYWENLHVEEHADLDAFFAAHPDAAARGWFASSKVPRPYTSASFEKGCYLFFGAETSGLPGELLTAHQSRCITIPILGPVRSFNLANSVGIVLFEAIRQIQTEVFTWTNNTTT